MNYVNLESEEIIVKEFKGSPTDDFIKELRVGDTIKYSLASDVMSTDICSPSCYFWLENLNTKRGVYKTLIQLKHTMSLIN